MGDMINGINNSDFHLYNERFSVVRKKNISLIIT